MQEAEIASVMAADGSTVADPEETACPTTSDDGPDRGVLRGSGSSSDHQTPVRERPDPGPPMGPAPPSPEQEAALDMDIDYEKVEDPDTEDSERDIFDRDDLYASDGSDSEDETEDELEEQFKIGRHMDIFLSDKYIPDEGVDREHATAVQRHLIEFWTEMHKAYLGTGNKIYKLPFRCYKKLQAVRRKSYVPLVLKDVDVFIGVQDFDLEDLDHVRANR